MSTIHFENIVLSAVVILILLFIYRLLTRNHDFWKKRAILGPKPLPYFGNLLELIGKSGFEIDMERFRKHGRIYGYFEGFRPVLSVAEPKMLQTILVKEWHLFLNRRDNQFTDEVFKNFLSNLRDENWKRVRTVISPTFTSGKIKRMFCRMEKCCENSLETLQSLVKAEEEISLKKFFGAYTMDVIASCAFETKTDSYNNPQDTFVLNAYSFFRIKFWRIVIALVSPKVLLQMVDFNIIEPEATKFFRTVVAHLLDKRRAEIVNNQALDAPKDFLQLLVDNETSKSTSELVDDIKDITGAHFQNETNADIETNSNYLRESMRNFPRKITEIEMISQSVLFFVAGYETTSSLLTFCCYCLARDQDVQEKLYQELKQQQGNFTYETVNSLKYLNAVISETLRLYPPATRVERQVSVDYTFEEFGISIPKGTLITVPIYALHHDEKLHPDPSEFKPERFLTENVQQIQPYSYIPFLTGPRNCIGMRFALVEAKLMLCHAIYNYKFLPSNKTEDPLRFRKSAILPLLQVKSVYLKAKAR